VSFLVRPRDSGGALKISFESCADAAQEAEFLHAERKAVHVVVEEGTDEVFYTSKGPAPEDD